MQEPMDEETQAGAIRLLAHVPTEEQLELAAALIPMPPFPQ